MLHQNQVGSVVRDWNAKSARGDQIVGVKAQSVKQIMELMPMKAWEVASKCVSEMGWDKCPFTDENLSSKRIYPGFVWKKPGDKAWTDRGRVTSASMILMMEHVATEAVSAPHMKKLTKQQLDSKAELAAVLLSSSEELCGMHAFKEGVVDAELINLFRQGNSQLMMELVQVVQEKQKDFTVRDIGTIRVMIDKHIIHSQPLRVPSTSMPVLLNKIEQDAFNLVLQEMEYDVSCWEVHKGALHNHDIAVMQTKLSWRAKAFQNNKLVAENYLQAYTSLCVGTDPEGATRSLHTLQRKIETSLRLAGVRRCSRVLLTGLRCRCSVQSAAFVLVHDNQHV